MKKVLLGVLILLFSASFATPAMSQDFWAVICGISDYKSVNDLTYCNNDAMDIYNKCIEYEAPKKHIKLLVDKKAKKKKIKKACKWMKKKAKSGDICLFYFSGHGTYGPDVAPIDEADDCDEYICPWDTKATDFSKDIRDDTLDEWLTPITEKGAHVVVILDTCFAGGAIKQKVNINGKETEVLVKTMQGVPYKKLTDGFAKDLNKPGFVVLTACDDDEVAWEAPLFQNSYFTYHLNLASTGLADDNYTPLGLTGDGDGKISAEELFDAAIALDNHLYDVMGGTGKQNPQIYDGVPGEVEIIEMEW